MTAQRPQWAERLAVFDIETTGVDPYADRIVTAAVALLDNGKVTERHDWIINPGVPIPPAAVQVHGITNEIASASGVKPEIGIAQIVIKLLEMVERGYTLVAFNASFDITMLYAEAARYQIADLASISPIADPYYIDRKLDRYRRGKRTLVDVAQHYGVSLENAHDAAADAIAAGQVLYAIAAKYAPQLPATAMQMHDALIAWERELTLDFKEYLQRNGKPNDNVVPGWPIKPTVI
ncbi:3'-5' exonuclease [Leucobacter sp. OH2974_COT-288]|nr:3'-5' exonuclease [Leucobacter sp. OH2974_COT-288]